MANKLSKRIILFFAIIIIFLSLIFYGVKKFKIEPTASDKYGCLTVFNTSWGMSIDECLKALKLKKEDVEIKAEDGFSHFDIDENFLGKKVKVAFEFYDEVQEETIPIGLYKVNISFGEQLDLKTAKAQIIKEYKVKNIEFEEVYKPVLLKEDRFSISYENKNKVASLGDDSRAKYSDFLLEFGSKDSDLAMEIRKDRTLSSVSVVLDKNKNVYSIQYEGLEAALINQASKQK